MLRIISKFKSFQLTPLIFYSISFELMELTFQHWLPNFNECWWDSWILDVAVCNAIGIVTGMWTVRYFKSKEYNWRGISQQPNLVAKARRGLMQFTPHTFDDFQWNVFSSPKRWLQCCFPVFIILLFEVNHFFLKFELWVPPRNPLNTIRLSILFLMALPGIKVRKKERKKVFIVKQPPVLLLLRNIYASGHIFSSHYSAI